jgi:hypothetical protein
MSNGKGSKRRKENLKKIIQNWDEIDWTVKNEQKTTSRQSSDIQRPTSNS